MKTDLDRYKRQFHSSKLDFIAGIAGQDNK